MNSAAEMNAATLEIWEDGDDLAWTVEQVGGGCEALFANWGGFVFCLTVADDPMLPVEGEPASLGIYRGEDGYTEQRVVSLTTYPTPRAAKDAANRFAQAQA